MSPVPLMVSTLSHVSVHVRLLPHVPEAIRQGSGVRGKIIFMQVSLMAHSVSTIYRMCISVAVSGTTYGISIQVFPAKTCHLMFVTLAVKSVASAANCILREEMV